MSNIKTAGTAATNSYTNALQYLPGYGSGASAADLATIALAIVNDQGNIRSNSTSLSGLDVGAGVLTLPGGRGKIKLLPGDWIMVDPSGWPIVVSGNVLPKTLTLTGSTATSKTLTVTTSAITAGWTIGMVLAAAQNDIPAATTITAISSNGLTITMSAAATGTNAGQTITAGTWTHS
jgi:hypothetical protein